MLLNIFEFREYGRGEDAHFVWGVCAITVKLCENLKVKKKKKKA